MTPLTHDPLGQKRARFLLEVQTRPVHEQIRIARELQAEAVAIDAVHRAIMQGLVEKGRRV